MFTAEQYRAKAAEYGGYLAAAQSRAESVEYRDLQQSFGVHADNMDWLTAHAGKTISSDPLTPRAASAATSTHQTSRRTSCTVSEQP